MAHLVVEIEEMIRLLTYLSLARKYESQTKEAGAVKNVLLSAPLATSNDLAAPTKLAKSPANKQRMKVCRCAMPK